MSRVLLRLLLDPAKNSRSDFEIDQAHWPYGGYLKLLFKVESFQRKLDPELPLST